MRTYEFNDTHRGKLQKQLNRIICEKTILATSDYCLHNQSRFHNSIELKLYNFIIQSRMYMFKQGD